LQIGQLINEKELEDLLCTNIEILNKNWFVIGRQVKTSAGKYNDILCMDRDGDLVIVELKKALIPREVTA
jgi:RecB family endonuclease NucS